MTEPSLPDMVVEKRDPKSAHRVPEPVSDPDVLGEQLQEAIQLNQDAGLYRTREMMYAEVDAQLMDMAWTPETLAILRKYIGTVVPDVSDDEIITASKDVMGCAGFDVVARWVQDDMCSEFFNRALKYCINEQQPHRQERGFIDGSGIGYLDMYRSTLKRNIEKAFDAKWFYKFLRPLQYAWETNGMNLERVANAVHPGHWSFPQGHATKSLTSVEVLSQRTHKLDGKCYRNLLIAALVFGHGRDGNLIHWPQDTYGSGYVTNLPEFAE